MFGFDECAHDECAVVDDSLGRIREALDCRWRKAAPFWRVVNAGGSPLPPFFISVDSNGGYNRLFSYTYESVDFARGCGRVFDKCGFQSTCRYGTCGGSFADKSDGPASPPLFLLNHYTILFIFVKGKAAARKFDL